jgi:hypothetical protein
LTKGLTASENVMSEVDLVSKALLTRPNLETVARETDLDLRADNVQEMELLITGLQKRVTVQGGRDNIFRISFQDRNRAKATAVVAALLDTFMESSLGAQGEDAKMSERAIAVEIEDHEQRLLNAEVPRLLWPSSNRRIWAICPKTGLIITPGCRMRWRLSARRKSRFANFASGATRSRGNWRARSRYSG